MAGKKGEKKPRGPLRAARRASEGKAARAGNLLEEEWVERFAKDRKSAVDQLQEMEDRFERSVDSMKKANLRKESARSCVRECCESRSAAESGMVVESPTAKGKDILDEVIGKGEGKC